MRTLESHWTYCLYFHSNYSTHSLYHFEKPAIVATKSYIFIFMHVKPIEVTSGFNLIVMKKSARWLCHTEKSKTNIKKLISPLLTRTQGSQGCQKMGQDPLNMPYEVWCANIAPKLKNIRKCLWKQGFFDDFSSILTVFCSLYNLRAILAQKENTFICRKKNVIFWHPWDPWGRINSGKNVFWVQTATVNVTSECQMKSGRSEIFFCLLRISEL